MQEKAKTAPSRGSGCFGWLLGLGKILGIKPVEPILTTSNSLNTQSSSPRTTCVDPATFKYTDPSLVPSQPEYYVRVGGRKYSSYNGQDRRGG